MKHELMNGVLGQLCAHIGQTGPGESPENGEENQMILPDTRFEIRTQAVWGRATSERRRNICFFETRMGGEPRSFEYDVSTYIALNFRSNDD